VGHVKQLVDEAPLHVKQLGSHVLAQAPELTTQSPVLHVVQSVELGPVQVKQVVSHVETHDPAVVPVPSHDPVMQDVH
jgi:hypothetical protein